MCITYEFVANLHITERLSILFLTKYDTNIDHRIEQKHTQEQVFQ